MKWWASNRKLTPTPTPGPSSWAEGAATGFPRAWEGKLAGLSLGTPAVGCGLVVCLRLAWCLVLATLILCQETWQFCVANSQTDRQTLSGENLLFRVTSPLCLVLCVEESLLLCLKDAVNFKWPCLLPAQYGILKISLAHGHDFVVSGTDYI